MAVLTYKGGKYRNLAGNKIFDGEKWLDISGDSKIFLNGKWRNFSWMTGSTDIPEGESPVYPGVPEPELTEETLVHVPSEKPEGTVWYVTPGGSGTKDGTSWENAFSASQIHVALLSCKDGDSVFMSEGDFGGLDRTMVIPENVSVYGGFPVSDPAWENRNGFTFSTIWQGNKTFPPFVCAGSQHTIDGISFKDFSGEATDSQAAVIRNCSLFGGDFSFSGAMNNCKASDCSVSIGSSAERVLIVNTAASDFLVTGNVTDATLFLSGGKFKAADVDAAYICSSDTEVTSLSGSTVVEGEITAESAAASFIAGAEKAFAETVKNCTVLESSTLFAEVSDSALYNCKNIITEITDCKITNGAVDALKGQYGACNYLSYISGGYLYYMVYADSGYTQLKHDRWGWTESAGYLNSGSIKAYGVCNGDLYSINGIKNIKLIDSSVEWENIIVDAPAKDYLMAAAMVKDGKLFVAVNDNVYTYDDCNYEMIASNIYVGGSVKVSILVTADGGIKAFDIDSSGRKSAVESSSSVSLGFPPADLKYKKLLFLLNEELTDGTSYGRVVEAAGITEDNIVHIGGNNGYGPYKIRDVSYGYRSSTSTKYRYILLLDDGSFSTIDKKDIYDSGGIDFTRCFGGPDKFYAITQEGELYVSNQTDKTIKKFTDLKGWSEVFFSSGNLSRRDHAGLCNGVLYSFSYSSSDAEYKLQPLDYTGVKASGCEVVNCECGCISGRDSRFINSSSDAFSSEANTLFVNCRGDVSEAAYSTVVNSDSSLQSGTYNVFWNNNGTAPAADNAQSAYSSENILTLGSNNDIARFESTGYSPAMGPQDAGVCPDPVTDPEGYNAYIDSFGDWQPKNNSFLIGKGVRLEDVPTDIEGTERPETPTLGAFEPKPEVSE